MKPVAINLASAALAALGITVAGSMSAQAQELGRLFFTPEQRAALDARRKARVPDKPAAAPVTESPITRINGAVQRGGGKSTVWVNGEMIPEDAQPGGARLAPRGAKPGSVSIPAAEGPQRHHLPAIGVAGGDQLERPRLRQQVAVERQRVVPVPQRQRQPLLAQGAGLEQVGAEPAAEDGLGLECLGDRPATAGATLHQQLS